MLGTCLRKICTKQKPHDDYFKSTFKLNHRGVLIKLGLPHHFNGWPVRRSFTRRRKLRNRWLRTDEKKLSLRPLFGLFTAYPSAQMLTILCVNTQKTLSSTISSVMPGISTVTRRCTTVINNGICTLGQPVPQHVRSAQFIFKDLGGMSCCLPDLSLQYFLLENQYSQK